MENIKEFIITIFGLLSIVFLFGIVLWGVTLWMKTIGKFIDYIWEEQ